MVSQSSILKGYAFLCLALSTSCMSCKLFTHASTKPSVVKNDGTGNVISYNLNDRSGVINIPVDGSDQPANSAPNNLGRVRQVIRSNYDPSQRSSFLGINNNGSYKFISEVQPDAAIEVSKNFSAAIQAAAESKTGQSLNAAINAANSSAEKVSELGARNPSNFLLRDALYRLNELTLNGGDTPNVLSTFDNTVENISSVAIHEADAQAIIAANKAIQAVANWRSDSIKFVAAQDSLGRKISVLTKNNDSLKEIIDLSAKDKAKKKDKQGEENTPLPETVRATAIAIITEGNTEKKKK